MSCFVVWHERGVPKYTLDYLYRMVMTKNGRPGDKSTSKVTIRRPGVRMLDYDLKLQFTLKTKM